MHAQDRDVRAVHGAAHVEAAGQGDPNLGRQLVAAEVLKQVVHDGLDDARGVDGPSHRPAQGIDFADQGQTNVLAEYTLHNLSDVDFTYSGPAVVEVQIILQTLAPRYGYNPANTSVYNNGFRNPVLSFSTAEHLLMLYSNQGLAGVQAELDKLKKDHII